MNICRLVTRVAAHVQTTVALLVTASCMLFGAPVFAGEASQAARCTPPAYAEVHDLVNEEGSGALYLSLLPSDLSLANLLCLVESLKTSHRHWDDVAVFVFDSYEAARLWRPVQNRQPGAVRATYLLNRRLNQESLSLHLLRGSDDQRVLDTTFDLSKASRRRCRFEVSGRCLLAIDGPERFDERVIPAGRVMIKARINKAGQVENAQIVEPDRGNLKDAEVLEARIIAHLNTWRFEPSSRAEEFTVTYRYVIDSQIILPTIEIRSATEVTIRANPAITNDDFRRLIEKRSRP